MDGTVRLWVWDAMTGQPAGLLMIGHMGRVYSVAFSPDDNAGRILSSGEDNTVRMWDAGSQQPIGKPMTGHTSGVRSVAFSPDGHHIVSGSSDSTLRTWPAPASSVWAQLLCDKLPTNMSRQQWRDWVSPFLDYTKVCPDLPIAAD